MSAESGSAPFCPTGMVSEHPHLLWLRCGRFGSPECPRAAENNRASLWTSLGRILVVVLEEENQVFRRENVIGLKTNSMNGIVRNPARGHGNPRDQIIATITGNLPLIIPN